MKPRYWSLAIVLVLINYLIFATLFTFLTESSFSGQRSMRTPVPTFTPALAEPIIIVPTPEPVTPEPSPTPTRVIAQPESNADEGATAGDSVIQAGLETSPEATNASLISPGSVNIRSGPGPEYPIIGTLNPNTEMPIVGRNADATWWQIDITGSTTGWVANTVVQADYTKNVPVVEAPSP
ncbi:MAG: SH3 domain-containing protein [Anaerolineae bacterium]|nr:SH3 domain-containing protein [Anaerolineae bacterium]